MKGYQPEGDYYRWEPQYEIELDPEEAVFPPGAMRRGELDDFDYADIEEF